MTAPSLASITEFQKLIASKPGVCDVKVSTNGPVEKIVITDWEKKHQCTLPDDLKNLYLTYNGINIKWSSKCGDIKTPVGRIQLNPLELIVRMSGYCDHYSDRISFLDLEFSDEEDDSDNHRPNLTCQCCRIFELESLENGSYVALVYRNCKLVPGIDPEIWLVDRSFRFHLLAPTFSQYYRLLVLHQGIAQWQHLYSDLGVTPQVKQWFHLYAPVRLEVASQGLRSASAQTELEKLSSLDPNKVFRSKADKKKTATVTPAAVTGSTATSSSGIRSAKRLTTLPAAKTTNKPSVSGANAKR